MERFSTTVNGFLPLTVVLKLSILGARGGPWLHFCSVHLNKKLCQEQPSETFCGKRCFSKFCKFDRKKPVLKSLFNTKKRLQRRCFPVKFAKNFKNCFEEHLLTAASAYKKLFFLLPRGN